MSLFSVIADAQAIIRSKNGIYKQVKLYERGDMLFAAQGGGFVRLLRENRTSNPNIKWEHLDGLQYVEGTGSDTGVRYTRTRERLRAA